MTRNARLRNFFTSLFSASVNYSPPTWHGSHRSPIIRRCFSRPSPTSQKRGLKVSTIEDSRSTAELQNSDDGDDDKNVAFNQTLSLVNRGIARSGRRPRISRLWKQEPLSV